MLRKAIEFASKKHEGKTRDDGTPYIQHPLQVALYAKEYGCKTSIIVAAILHGIIEDCGVHYTEIQRMFGQRVARMVLNLTKPTLSAGSWIFAGKHQ
ncbi:MAG: HD domain-containing protein [Candidatus Micrarchaeia archaeon]